MPQRTPPGPAGTSCLTCKLRHKRCDKRQPECERCVKGGYDCLGYGHIRRGAAGLKSRGSLIQRLSPSMEHGNPISSSSAELSPATGHDNSDSSEALLVEGRYNSLDGVASSSSASIKTPGVCHEETFNNKPDKNSLASTSKAWTSWDQPPVSLRISTLDDSHINPSPQQLFALSTRIPSARFENPKVFFCSVTFEDYVLAHGEMMMELSYFKPAQDQSDRLRRAISIRLKTSSFARWVMFLCARVCESFVNGDATQSQIYNRWIGDVERALKGALTQDLASREAYDRLGNCLEVSQSSSIYKVLRTATPTFLQMVYADPKLWLESRDPTSIPLGQIVTSTHHALSHFALTDSLSAMAFGLPQQVEYDTIDYVPTSCPVPFEWGHSTPAIFQVLLADINACRDKQLGARTWKDLEQQLLAWEAQSDYYNASWETWMISAWFAVQESWRLALLVYLYMAVCGRPSDDGEVQVCTQQIFEVISMVKQPVSSKAGICAQSESQRTLSRNRLSTVSETRLWLMRGRDFVPVLEHLWQGMAANGQPVRWSDYLASREAVLPVAP
ncbi:fungal zn(2)-Cys(6) binuclear cluster domain-containing protein [Rhizoctonia solani AG-1 IA]|uniref:Fungal zn(2)-Cys(6) binuclear cluster domain-containing protein n=1 Tax=Thanatephorus cucumeris (strain AG1-IA) TaxID=983506 RepID=L8X023_THACA|nr:fungal zn(2)-Cys(6) binuclear cluster domain-containing protein [Rhizoctonia solani AG-1 IA]